MDSLDTIRTLSRPCALKELRGASSILYLYGNEFDEIMFTSLVMKHQANNQVFNLPRADTLLSRHPWTELLQAVTPWADTP